MQNNLEKLEVAYTHLLMIERDISEAQFNLYSALKSHEITPKGDVRLSAITIALKQMDTNWMLIKECLEEVRDNLYESGERLDPETFSRCE
jgi:hypothetical protein